MDKLTTGRRRWRFFAGAVTIISLVSGVVGIGIAIAADVPGPPRAGGWLSKLPADKQIEAIDRQFRGFDMAMFETNYRYTEMYFAGIEGNWDYALYTGQKIAWAIKAGYERRPKRQANADELFFKDAFPNILDAIEKQDHALFKQRIDDLRRACNACHTAEKVPFIHVSLPAIKQTPLVHD